MTEGSPQIGQLVLALAAGVLLLGIVQGFRDKIVVFRDFDDLGLCFALPAAPALIVYVGAFHVPQWAAAWLSIAAVVMIVLIGLIVRRTWVDNGTVLSTALALATKIPLGILFVGALVGFVTPTGRTAAQRASSRQLAFLGLLLLTPLVHGLTRDRSSFARLRVPHL